MDAYDGTVTLYEWTREGEQTDPILKAWMATFPDVVKPYKDISPDLMAHLRYPEDLFKVQRDLLASYHITDPKTFYGGSENWRVPADPNSGDAKQPPFFLTVKLPSEDPEFSLTSVYEPNSRQNLASFMAVNADAQSTDYGKFTVLELPSDNAVSGPSQVANAMENDAQVSGELLKYKQNGTTVQMGNLLTLPVGDELLYAQPVYTLRGGTGTGSYPILQFVVLSIGDNVGIGTSFDAAFASAEGLPAPGTTPPTDNKPPPDNKPPTNQTPEQQVSRYLAEAQNYFNRARDALNAGDLGKYQQLNAKGAQALNKAIAVREGATGPRGASSTGGGG